MWISGFTRFKKDEDQVDIPFSLQKKIMKDLKFAWENDKI